MADDGTGAMVDDDDDDDDERFDFQDYAAVRAELDISPDAVARLVVEHGFPDAVAFAEAQRKWRARIDASPSLQRSYRRFYDEYHRDFAAAAAKREAQHAALTPRPAPPAPPSMREPDPAPLPATPGDPPAAEPRAAWLPAAMRGFADVEGTQLATNAGPSVVLPFVARAPGAPPPPDLERAIPKAMRGITDIGGTLVAPSVPSGPALPFAPTSSARAPEPALPSAPASARAPEPASAPIASIPRGMQAFTDVEGTQIAPEAPASTPILPFDPNAAPTLPPQASTPASSSAPAWMPKSMRGFADVEGTQIAPEAPSAPVLPFAAPPPVSTPRATAARAPAPVAAPAAVPAPAAASVAVPVSASAPAPARPHASTLMASALSLEQYASLCVELELDPGRRAETLRRYRVTDDQYGQLDAHWRARMVADASLRASWETAYTVYRAWLIQQRGGR